MSSAERAGKDSRIILQLVENLNFKIKDEEFLFVRRTHISEEYATVLAVNFSVPALEGVGQAI